MTGETDLSKLIQEMKPEIRQIELVFCTLPWDDIPQTTIDPLLLFKEVEGMTIILPKAKARQLGFSFENTWTWIELSVHSSLDAVGFIAAVTHALAEADISVNVVSAFNHDHLFVPDKQAKKAIKVLEEMIRNSS
ncbi:MAG: ACT domain-containing protein [Candidatus Thorarchaeota archaeon]